MTVSTKIGALPILGSLWDHGPFAAGLMLLFVDFGVIYALMFAESLGPNSSAPAPWKRSLYKSFLWSDTIFIPLFGVSVVMVLQKTPSMDGYFFTTLWWHLGALTFGFVLSIRLEIDAVKGGQFTMSQEFSPSKLWHTFVYGFMAYWLITGLASVIGAIVIYGSSGSVVLLLAVSIAGFVFSAYRDAQPPAPWDAHVEGSWSKWDWHVRPK